MAYERLQALGKYLQECENLPNFSELLGQQCAQLSKQIREGPALDFNSGAALIALVQQEARWQETHKHSLCALIQAKVEEATAPKTLSGGRLPLQDFTFFPCYLSEADWKVVMDNKSSVLAHRANRLTERCHRLGLFAPSEDTYAMFTTVLLLPEQHRFTDGLSLRSSYLSVKTLVKQHLKNKEKEDADKTDFLRQLPAEPNCLDARKLEQAYDHGDKPANKFPQGVTIELLHQLKKLVPLRSTNKSVNMQFPKASGHPMEQMFNQNAMMQMWQQAAAFSGALMGQGQRVT